MSLTRKEKQPFHKVFSGATPQGINVSNILSLTAAEISLYMFVCVLHTFLLRMFVFKLILLVSYWWWVHLCIDILTAESVQEQSWCRQAAVAGQFTPNTTLYHARWCRTFKRLYLATCSKFSKVSQLTVNIIFGVTQV